MKKKVSVYSQMRRKIWSFLMKGIMPCGHICFTFYEGHLKNRHGIIYVRKKQTSKEKNSSSYNKWKRKREINKLKKSERKHKTKVQSWFCSQANLYLLKEHYITLQCYTIKLSSIAMYLLKSSFQRGMSRNTSFPVIETWESCS